MSGRVAEPVRESEQKVYRALERLLEDLRTGKVTGKWKLFGSANQGGVTDVDAKIVVKPKLT